MNHSRIHFHWRDRDMQRRFRTGVSLHSHTLHSRECLGFIHRISNRFSPLAAAMRRYRTRYRNLHGTELDLTRAWWTPPLSAHDAWELERSQIETSLGLEGLVSLTDHDNIDAPVQLQILDQCRKTPISVEWTAPYGSSFVHIGLHNLPPAHAQTIMCALSLFTAKPSEKELGPILDWVSGMQETLVVLNHPLWDEKGIGAVEHGRMIERLLSQHRASIHAFELNGLRPWSENRGVAALGKIWDMPLISGGDRHGREPGACVNLTNASSFCEFVHEIRNDRWSNVLFMPHYRESFSERVIQNIWDILRDDPQHRLGWIRWTDRVFYRCDDGIERPLAKLWGANTPAIVRGFVGMISLAGRRPMRSALRFALTREQEFAL